MAKKKVADLLVDVLAEAGVRQIYGVPGDSLNGVTESIRAKKQIQWIREVDGGRCSRRGGGRRATDSGSTR